MYLLRGLVHLCFGRSDLRRQRVPRNAEIMLKSPSSRRPGRTGEPRESNRRRLVVTIAVTVLVALIITTTALLLVRDDQNAGDPGPSDVPSATTGTAPTASPTSEPTGRRSTADALESFLSRAATLDRRLTEAAAAINAAGPPWTEVSPTLARKVQAADLDQVVSAFPAGMPDDLRQAAVLVLSDLYSRRYAMQSFAYPGPKHPNDPLAAHDTTAQLLSELRNGHAAAVRFDRDLATARSVATTTPPIAPVPKESRLTAEALLLVAVVHNANVGGDVRGGVVITRLPLINWGPVPGDAQADGTVGVYKLPFHAKFINGNWEVYLLVG